MTQTLRTDIAKIATRIQLDGGQLAFPPTQIPSSDPNTLDDYEEGSWTPSLGGSATYSFQSAVYIKIGRLVYIRGILQVNVIGSGSLTSISGLPFALAGSPAGNAAIPVVYSENLAIALVSVGLGASGSGLNGYGRTAAAATVTLQNIFGNSARVDFCGVYEIA